MTSNLTDLRGRLTNADPAGDALPYPPDRCEAVVTDIVAGTHTAGNRRPVNTPLLGPLSRPLHYARPVRRRLTRTLVAASVIAIVAGLIAIAGHDPYGGGSSESARAVLVTAAANASDPPARASQYWEITTAAPDGQTRIQYVAVDGNRASYFIDTHPADRDSRQPQREVWTTELAPNQESGWWGNPNPAYLATLPRRTSALRELLYRDTTGRGNSVDGEAFTYVADLLRSGVVPADLRRSLFHVLQTIPGIDITAVNAVVDGRTGTVVGYRERAPWGVHEVLLDIGTGMMTAERDIGTNGWNLTTRRLVDDIPPEVRASALKR